MDAALELKLTLATRGVRLDQSAAGVAPSPGVGEVDLVLPSGMRVTAPLAEQPTAPRLIGEGDRFYVVAPGGNGARTEVRPRRIPHFYARTTTRGVPMARIASAHGSHLLVHPGPSCGFSVTGSPCRFCVEGARGQTERDTVATVADVVDAVRAAFEEGVADFVYFNTSAFEVDDGGFAALAPYVEAVRRHFDTLVAVQVHPPAHRPVDRPRLRDGRRCAQLQPRDLRSRRS